AGAATPGVGSFNRPGHAAKATRNEGATLAREAEARVCVPGQADGSASDGRAADAAFEPFAEETAVGKGGAGLGLTIARELAVLMGGSLDVAPTAGTGRVFTLTLPRAPDADQSAVA